MKYGKIVPACLGAVLLLAACGGGSESAVPAQSGDTLLASSNVQDGRCTLEERNKELVRRVYTDVVARNKTELVKTLFSADYIQHDPSVPSGPAGQVTLIQNLEAQTPGLVATIKHISADGDFVAVHWQASATPANEASGQAVSDLYRVVNNKIVEHWDTFQQVPPSTPSGNSMFSDLYKYTGKAPRLTEAQEETNKQMVVSAYKGLFNDRNKALLDQYWDPNYLQHNPWVGNGTGGLKQFLEFMPTGGPPLDFFQTVADGDLVYTFSLSTMPSGPNPGDPMMTRMLTDIFRVACGKIVEHWDIQ